MSTLQLPEELAGPLFISIGDVEKLNVFLEKNPAVKRSSIFVDGYRRSVYQIAGLGLLTDVDRDKVKGIVLVAPELGGLGDWWNYLTSVMSLSPIESGKPGIPEGVLQLGGTFLINANHVVYQYNDLIPGNTPDLDELQDAIGKAVAE